MIGLWVAAVALGKNPCATEASVEANSAEILRIFEEGEAEREDRAASAVSVLKRDEKRVKLMVKYARKGWLCNPEDRWHAAWLMMQADELETLELAYELALDTMNARLPRGPWLVAFTFDRKRIAGGFRQSYGTQTRVDAVGRRCMIELEGDTTDATRAEYGVPSLTELYRSVLDLNGFTEDDATEQRMRRHSLICPPLAISPRDQRRIAPPE